jgi:hypothetical protein
MASNGYQLADTSASIVLSTGFLIVPSSIPPWLQWVQYIAYPGTFYKVLASNEFTDNYFACPYVGTGTLPSVNSGTEI